MKLFELFADLSLNSKGFSDGVKSAAKQGNNLASTLKDGIGGAASFVSQKVSATTIALGNLMADAVKATAGVAKDLVQNVFEEYANTEQLYGGVETIFKNSADLVKKNADEAFMTAGMSANEYMQTVTSFSSSLLQGLDGDTKKAAEVADMAIKDMSDNANKFGTDMGLIQNAYQGFAKDNFTMLDNLKLGYGGTQAEMARLINDSGVLGGKLVTAANVAEVPLDKMFEAIHKIQTEMDITGTTAAEAADTISGSFASFKASWRNLLSGLADEKEVDVLVDNLFETGENLITNLARLVPRIGRNTLEAFDAFLENFDVYNTLKNAYKTDGVAGVVEKLKEEIGDELAKIGPIAIDTGADLIAGIYTGLTGDTTSKEQVKVFFSGLWEDAVAAKDTVVAGAQGILNDIYIALTGDTTGQANVKSVFDALWKEASDAVQPVVSTASGIFSSIYQGLTGQEATKENIVKTFSDLWTDVAASKDSVVKGAQDILGDIYVALTGDTANNASIKGVFDALWADVSEAGNVVISAAGGLLGSIYEGFTGQETTKQNIIDTISGLFSGGLADMETLKTNAAGLMSGIASAITSDETSITDVGEALGGMFAAGHEAMESLRATASGLLGSIYTTISGQEATAENIGKTIGGVFNAGVTAADDVLSVATTFFSDVSESLGDPDASVGEKISGIFNAGLTASAELLDATGNLLGNMYAALTNDEATAVKIKTFFDELFATPAEWKERYDTITSLPEYAEQRRDEAVTTRTAGDVLKMLSSMQASGFISESQFDEWSPAITSAVMSGTEGEDYAQIAAAIVDAFNQMTSEQERRENEAQKRHETEEDDSDLSGAVTVLQTVAESLSTLKADVTAAAKEGCMAGVGSITVTGSVSTGNVMLNTGALVGSLAPKLNLKLGVLNARG